MTKYTGKRPHYGSDLATKIAFYTRTDPDTGCRVWMGARKGKSLRHHYGQLYWGGRVAMVHRLVWAAERGPIPAGLFVCHACDNPPCCNIEHLFLGTNADNMADMARKGRAPRRLGIQHSHAKLTDEKVLEIRASQLTGGALAQQLGVSKTLVNMVRRRDIWKHI